MKSGTGTHRALVVLALTLTACATGCRPDDEEVDPAAGVKLEDGSVAVDPADDGVYVGRKVTKDATSFRALFRLDHQTGSTSFFADLTKLRAPHLVVTEGGVLIADEDAEATVYAYDRSANLVGQAAGGPVSDAFFASPSRKYVLGASRPTSAYRFIDAATLDIHELVPLKGTLGRVLWGRKRDALFATYFDDTNPDMPAARFLGWDVKDLQASSFAVDETTGLWTGPFVDVPLQATPNTREDWDAIALSPNDEVAAFPAFAPDGAGKMEESVVIVDITTGDLDVLSRRYGPVAFSSDGTWLVTGVYSGKWGLSAVQLPDGAEVPIGTYDSSLPYYVSHVTDDLLFTGDHTGPLHYDFTTQKVTGPAGSGKGDRYSFGFTIRFPSTPFLYGIDYTIKEKQGTLERGSFETGELTRIDLPFKARAAAGMPNQKLIVASDQDSPLIRVLDPDTGAVQAEYNIDLN